MRDEVAVNGSSEGARTSEGTQVRRTLLVTSCGTSLFTNLAGGDERTTLRDLTNLREDELDASARATVEALRDRATEHLHGCDEASARRASAELNAIAQLVAEDGPTSGVHFLVHSDTALGAAGAEVLAEHLRERHPATAVSLVRVPDLSTRSYEGFRAALSWLARWADESLPGYRPSHRVVFNLTGGFKSVNGFLQVLATFHGDELIYVFEAPGSPLIRIPRLPLRLDAPEILAAHWTVLRRMAAFGQVPREEARQVPETLVLEVGDQAALSEWGELVWLRASAERYAEVLQEPLVPSLRFADRFRREVDRLTPDRRRKLNRQLDALAAYQHGGREHGLRSLSFKALVGDPVAGSTHEFYAWSDEDAARCFAHHETGPEGEVVVVDRLGKHL